MSTIVNLIPDKQDKSATFAAIRVLFFMSSLLSAFFSFLTPLGQKDCLKQQNIWLNLILVKISIKKTYLKRNK